MDPAGNGACEGTGKAPGWQNRVLMDRLGSSWANHRSRLLRTQRRLLRADQRPRNRQRGQLSKSSQATHPPFPAPSFAVLESVVVSRAGLLLAASRARTTQLALREARGLRVWGGGPGTRSRGHFEQQRGIRVGHS